VLFARTIITAMAGSFAIGVIAIFATAIAPASAPAPAASPAPVALGVAADATPPIAREVRQDDHPRDGLLVRATARSLDKPEEVRDAKLHLTDARTIARQHATDPHALKAWAIAAMHAGETREARRAAEAWAVHDTSAEPRLFLAAALESNGRKREARAVLEEWLTNHPDSSDAKRMLARLGAAPDPVIKRGARNRGSRTAPHPPDPVADE